MKQLIVVLLAFGFFVIARAQTFSNLQNALVKEFSENSTKDGRWVFYADKANIEKVDKPLIKVVVPNYDIYSVNLTNYLGYHINQGTCVVLFDSLKSKIVLVEPIWYGGISESIIKLFLKKQFKSTENLLNFLKELNDVMEIGSGYKFVNTGTSGNLITYDLVYSKGDSYTTSGNGVSSTVNYTKDGVWRQIEIKVRDLKMIEYTSINPAMKNNKEYKVDYKKVIR